jgi:hypothetical protein
LGDANVRNISPFTISSVPPQVVRAACTTRDDMAIDGMVGEMTAEEALLAVLFVTANTQALAANTQTIVTAIFFIVDANAEDSRPRFCDVTTCPLAAGLPLDGSVRAVSLGISGRLATPAW